MKGDLERISELIGELEWTPIVLPWLNPSHAGAFSIKTETGVQPTLGVAGLLSRHGIQRLKLRQDAYIGELLVDPWCIGYYRTRQELKFRPFSRYPAVQRDFSLLISDERPFSQVLAIISTIRKEIPEVVKVDAVDVFRGKNVPKGKYSLLVRVTFESHQATLTEAQLTDFSSRIVTALEQKLNASLRAS